MPQWRYKQSVTWHVGSCHDSCDSTEQNSKHRCKVNIFAVRWVVLPIMLVPVLLKCLQPEASVVAVHHPWSITNQMVCFWNRNLRGYTRFLTLILTCCTPLCIQNNTRIYEGCKCETCSWYSQPTCTAAGNHMAVCITHHSLQWAVKQNGRLITIENSVTGLNGGIPGEESIQTGPTCCHLDPNITIMGTAFCRTPLRSSYHHWHSILWNPLRPLYHYHDKASRHAHEVSHHLAKAIPISPALSWIRCTLRVIECTVPSPLQPELSLCDLHVCYHRFRSDEDVPPAAAQCSTRSSESFSQTGFISWCVNGLPTSIPVLTTFKSINKFTQNKPLTGEPSKNSRTGSTCSIWWQLPSATACNTIFLFKVLLSVEITGTKMSWRGVVYFPWYRNWIFKCHLDELESLKA